MGCDSWGRKESDTTERLSDWTELNWVIDTAFPGGSALKSSPADAGEAGDASSVPGWRRPPGEGSGNPLQYSCLENSMDRRACWDIVYGVTKESTRLRKWAHTQSKWINLSVTFLNSRHPLKVCLLVFSISPQPFWHQGLVSRKTDFPHYRWVEMVSGWFKWFTFIVEFIIIITSAPPQILRH